MAEYVRLIRDFIRTCRITRVVDLGCGDFKSGRQLARLPGVAFTGVDVADELIAYNRHWYATPQVEFLRRDIVADPLPAAQLCLIQHVLEHLTNREIETLLSKCAQYRYLIVTELLPQAPGQRSNDERLPGFPSRAFKRSGVYLDKPPFNRDVIPMLAVYPRELPESKIVTYRVIL